MQWLTAYPIATISTLAFYLLLLSLAIPRLRAMIGPLFVHPIPPHQEYLRGFDTLRGFAASFVAIGHCYWVSNFVFGSIKTPSVIAFATKGVPMFAMLSGFLIFRSTLAIASISDLRAYAVRRFFRIYPVYLLGVVLCLLLGQYVGSQYFTGTALFVSDLFMFPVFFWPGGFANPPTWSLYVEVMFYAFLPFAVIVLGRRRMLMVAVIGVLAMILADYPSRFFVLWKYFLIGIIAAELSPRVAKNAAVLFGLGVVLLIIDLGGPRLDWVAKIGIGRLHEDGASIGLGLAFGLILLTLPHLDRISRALNILPLRLIGVISYSVYITQFVYIGINFSEINLFTQIGTVAIKPHLTNLTTMPKWYLPLVFFPGILFWGAVSFLLVEKPALRFGQRLIQRFAHLHKKVS
ncbi:MAG: Acyltransferase family protein [Betaproteobacteria bacterium ADurb.Bin341]|nr:MAG: Acyltransferase family protein [Betaproteobacteria bacterium ADurb.Bin341]